MRIDTLRFLTPIQLFDYSLAYYGGHLNGKGELKGYIKCLKRDVGEPAGLREAK